MPDPLNPAVAFAALVVAVIACGALYVAVLWRLLRRFGNVAAVAVWLVLTFGLAYLGFRDACRQALACDVEGVDYRWLYVPRFAFLFGTALGVCTLLVLRQAHRSEHLGRRFLLIGATSFLLCFFGAGMFFWALDTVTCGNRLWRRADGTLVTECVGGAEKGRARVAEHTAERRPR